MKKEHRPDEKLPVTAEVGSEGGSFADPAVQVATFERDIALRDSPDQTAAMGRPSSGSCPAGDTSSAAADLLRYPTEEPTSSRPGDRSRAGGINWRTGLAGAAAGAALAIAASTLRRWAADKEIPRADGKAVGSRQ